MSSVTCNITCMRHEYLFTESFVDFFVENKFSDLIFICKGNVTVKTHKTILASVSEFLTDIMRTSDQGIVYINVPDVDHNELLIFVNFLYEGMTRVDENEFEALKNIMMLLCIKLPSVDILSIEPTVSSNSVVKLAVNRDDIFTENENEACEHPLSENYKNLQDFQDDSAFIPEIALSEAMTHSPEETQLSSDHIISEDVKYINCMYNKESDSTDVHPHDIKSPKHILEEVSPSLEESMDELHFGDYEDLPTTENSAVSKSSTNTFKKDENIECVEGSQKLKTCDILESQANISYPQDNYESKYSSDNAENIGTKSKSGNSECNKVKRMRRSRITKEQKVILEAAFKVDEKPSITSLLKLARDLQLSINIVNGWFSSRQRIRRPGPCSSNVNCTSGSPVLKSCLLHNLQKKKKKNETYISCETCNKKFTNIKYLKNHSCKRDKKFKCKFCDASFTTASFYHQHSRVHTKEKPYKCKICLKAFSQKGNLKIHIRIHTGEKPYECAVCGAKFSQRSHLEQHSRLHTGEKPFKCNICETAFSQIANLNSHLKSHSGERLFKCKVCSCCYKMESTLKLHMKTHVL